MLRQDRHQSEDQREFAIVRAGKVETHGAFVDDFRLRHLGIIGAEIRPAFVTQKLPREHHVLRRHRIAVGKSGARVDPEGDSATRVVGLHALRQQSVERERFVVAACQQTFDHVAADALCRQSLDDEGVETVEGAEHTLDQPTALGGRRVGIANVIEALGQGGVAVHGDGMAGLGGRVGLHPWPEARENGHAQCERERPRPASGDGLGAWQRAIGGRGRRHCAFDSSGFGPKLS